jgi:hypothetical protein
VECNTYWYCSLTAASIRPCWLANTVVLQGDNRVAHLFGMGWRALQPAYNDAIVAVDSANKCKTVLQLVLIDVSITRVSVVHIEAVMVVDTSDIDLGMEL